MLKRVAILGFFVALTGCAQQPVYVPPAVIYTQPRYDHTASCEIYRRREANCMSYRYYDQRAVCIEDSRSRYYNCMTRGF